MLRFRFCSGTVTMALHKNTINIILLGFSFMFLFTAFQTMGNIQKTVLDSIKQDDPSFDGDGYYSLAIVYAVFAIVNWAAPSIISLTGPRIAIIIGAVPYTLFIMSFLLPRTWLLYLASAVVGWGAAVIWTGQGTYLALNSSPATISRNSGLFWALFQCSTFFGNLFVFFEFRGLERIDEHVRTIVFWALTAVSLVGIGLMFTLRPAVNNSNTRDAAPTPFEALKKAARLFITKEMLLLCVTFLYTGVVLSFYSGVYSSAIGFTKHLGTEAKQLIGMSGIFIGLGEVLGGSVFGLLGGKTVRWGRSPIVIAGFILHVVAFFLIFLNLPNTSPMGETDQDAYITTNGILAIFCSFLLGFGDSCYNTQMYSMLGGVFAHDSASAFALFKFTQSLAAAGCFFYSTSIGLYIQLGILVVSATFGTVTFCMVEYFNRNAIKVTSDPEDTDSTSNQME